MHDSWISLKFSMFIFNFLHEKDKNNYANNNILKMTLSLIVKKQEILYVLILCMAIRKRSFLLMLGGMEWKYMDIPKETRDEEVSKNLEHFRKLVKTS